MAERIPNGQLIKQLHDRLEKQANNELRPKDLTMMQVAVLEVLQKAEEQRLSMKELEHYFQVAQSTIAGIISRLEQKGFVETFCDSTDKRIKVVHITPAGATCWKEASIHMQETEEKLLSGFSQEEKDMLNTLLVKAIINIK